MSGQAQSATAAMYSRNEDPMTRLLRSTADIDIDELHTRAVDITKPTSDGTSYPLDDYKSKGKAIATYASSLSAAHGSGSDTELELLRDTALFGVGDWTARETGASCVIKGSARARKRSRPIRRLKHKKPVVVIQDDHVGSGDEEETSPVTEHVSLRNNKEVKYFRHRRTRPLKDDVLLAEEGLLDAEEPKAVTLSRTRIYALVAIIIAIILTFSVSIVATHYTGRTRINCTKGIIFATTVLISCFTVLALLVARRTLHEALLAGVLGFLIGFALVVEIHDFM